MAFPEKTFCNTYYRHLRLLFFVDVSVDSKFLIKIFVDNYKVWGGRYNPVIPVCEGSLSPFYHQMVANFDPDIVYHSQSINSDAVKYLCKDMHPREIIQLEPTGRNNFPGVYAHNLLSLARRHAQNSLQPFSLAYFQNHQDVPLSAFYSLNLGLTNQYSEDINLSQGYKKVMLDGSSIAETNQLLAEKRPYFSCLLSELQVNTTLTRPGNSWEFQCVELIIYNDDRPFDDLIYFWNRQLFQRPEGKVKQLIVSMSQIPLIIGEATFDNLLRLLAYENKIYLNSLSVSFEELESYRTSLQAAFPALVFRTTNNCTFPRSDGAESYPYLKDIRKIKSVLLGAKDHLRLPSPPWIPEALSAGGNYVYDVEFFEENENRVNFIKLPYGTVTHFLLGHHNARINKHHHVSFFLDTDKQGLDILVPTEAGVFKSRLRARVEHGELIDLPVQSLKPSDAGLKLASFVSLFGRRIKETADILTERFWIDLILGQSTATKKKNFQFTRTKQTPEGTETVRFHEKVKLSNIHNYDGIFSYADIKAERRLIYLEHNENIREWAAEHEQHWTDDELIEFMMRSADEDFQMHIDPYLQHLVNQNALFIGMKVKCRHCGSNTWYPLADLKNKMDCKGCSQTITPLVESHLYYRFNDIVYNNISSDPIKRSKKFHGNYIVLRTIGFFEEQHDSYESFLWTPCMDVEISEKGTTIQTDIDIAIIQAGRLILGEAKADASAFTREQFEKIYIMADTMRPDSIILAYNSGVINPERLEKLESDLKLINCRIITHQITDPNYYFGRLG